MSTLTVTNIKATGETASRSATGIAAAWINFNGTGTIATRDSFNVSGLIDLTLGQYDVEFTSDMGNDDYNVSGYGNTYSDTTNFSDGMNLALANSYGSMNGQLEGSCSLGSYTHTGSGFTDSAIAFLSTHGDLA